LPSCTRWSTRECDHRDDAVGLASVLGELREARGSQREQAVALLARSLLGYDVDGLAPHLDAREGLGPEIADPGRVALRAAVRGEDQVALAVAQVSDRVDPACARLGAGVVKQ